MAGWGVNPYIETRTSAPLYMGNSMPMYSTDTKVTRTVNPAYSAGGLAGTGGGGGGRVYPLAQMAGGGGVSGQPAPQIGMRPQDAAIAPAMQQGISGNMQNPYAAQLQQLMSGQFSPNDPSYQFRLQQGQQASERSLAARGLLGSGNALQELQAYGQGMASQEYGNQFNRALQAFGAHEQQLTGGANRLAQLAGIDYGQQNLQFNVDRANQQTNQGAYEFGANLGQRQYEFDANQSLQRDLAAQGALQAGQQRPGGIDVGAQQHWDQQALLRQFESGLGSALNTLSSQPSSILSYSGGFA